MVGRAWGATGLLVAIALIGVLPGAAPAQEYRVDKLAEAAPTEGLADEIRSELADEGIKVIKGTSRTFVDFWPAKKWATKADFAATNAILYPFQVGELIGVIRYKSKGTDFRGQEIKSGVYSVRYALQPEDGNHVGTSDTRDFLLLLPIESDTSPAAVEQDKLFKLSAEVAGTPHPAMLALQKANADAETLPAIEHNEERELYSLLFQGTADAGGQASALPVQVVVVGQAAE